MNGPLEINGQQPGNEVPKPSVAGPTELKAPSIAEEDTTSSVEQNLQFFWRSVSRGKYLILVSSVLIACLVYFYCKAQVPMYRASANVLIEPTSGEAEEIVGFSTRREWLESDIMTEKDVIQSRMVADRVVKNLELTKISPFKFSQNPTEMVLQMIKVEGSTRSRVLTLNARFSDPVLAAKIANETLNSYIETTEEQSRTHIMKTVDQIRAEVTNLKEQVDEAQRKVKRYKIEHPQIDSKDVLESQLQSLNVDLAKVSADRIALRTQLEELAAFQRQGADVREHPAIAKDPSVEQTLINIRQKQVELTQLLNIYKERFPTVVEKKAELETLQKILLEQKKQILEEMKSRYILLSAREFELRKELDAKSAAISALMGQVAGYETLVGQVEVTKNLYSMLIDRMNKTAIVGRSEQSKIKILSSAEVPQRPYSPQTNRNVSFAFLISLGAMSYFVYLFFLMLKPIESEEEIVQGLKLSVLAQLPFVPAKNEGEETELVVDQEGGFAKDALHVLRSKLAANGRNTILFASANPAEGKTFMVHNLGVFLAREGKKVLLVGTDFRSLSLKKRLHLNSNFKSLECFMNDKCAKEEVVTALSEPGLFYLGPEKELQNPLETITSPRFEKLIHDLASQFDYVLLDAPPVGLFADAAMLCQLVKDVICVIRYGQTPFRDIQKAASILRKSGANLIGSIINYRMLSAQDYYYHRYYYGSNKRRGRGGFLMNVIHDIREHSGRVLNRWKKVFSGRKK